ncbi:MULTISPECIES: hypothetical protein [Xanthomonas translucens group]|uniref:hypothetical protein n=1 Tax=Xanthomonas translucens group TaxID=3390202 RepID=UPI000A71FEBC|nr:hypothetical protein [Xanthomonas translucens]
MRVAPFGRDQRALGLNQAAGTRVAMTETDWAKFRVQRREQAIESNESNESELHHS